MATSSDSSPARLEAVAAKQEEWRSLHVTEKIKLIQALLDSLVANYGDIEKLIHELGEAEASITGFSPATSDGGRMMAALHSSIHALVFQIYLKKYLMSYKIYAGQEKAPKMDSYQHPLTGKTIVQSIPGLPMDKFSQYSNATCEVWLRSKEKDPKVFDVGSALAWQPDKARLVLGAGNHNFLTTIDVLNSLFHHNQVVYVKHHPLRGKSFDPVFRKFFAPLIDRGFVDSELDGGMERNKHLCHGSNHAVSSIHMTGGKASHDAIVWGHPTDRSKRRIGDNVQMTSELGCVSPWIVTYDPSQPYSAKALKHQAKTLVASKMDNAGHNCNSPQILILMEGWSQREQFLKHLRDELADIPVVPSYYPGAKARREGFIKAYQGQFEEYGNMNDEEENARRGVDKSKLVPLLFHPDLKVDLTTPEGREKAKSEYAFRNEFFGLGFFCVTVPDLEAAVNLSNDYLYGTLSMSIISPDKKLIEKALTDLRYGCIAVNGWSGATYCATGSCWGAYPGETVDKVESGIGHVGNLLFLQPDLVEKTILYMNLIDMNLQASRAEGVANMELFVEAMFRALGNFSLKPGVWTFANLMFALVPGLKKAVMYGGSSVVALVAGVVAERCLRSR